MKPVTIAHRNIQVNGITLHVAEAGPADGPLLILLHGFPESWHAWQDYLAPLAAAGFHLIVPDQRGYNLSGKPAGVASYALDHLARDAVALAALMGADRFQLVGHDWGGSVAWWIASHYPEHVERMVVLNAPHPAIWRRAMKHPDQRERSRYVQGLRLRFLPELFIRLGGYKALFNAFSSARPGGLPPMMLMRHYEGWRRPGALTAMINWYRALFRQDMALPKQGSLSAPTLILWGDCDEYAVPRLAEASAALCRDARVVHFVNSGHWLAYDARDVVVSQLLRFLDARAPSGPDTLLSESSRKVLP
jgi:pimeloyl-ACP methyl ester carboxylesterase